ncbi:uncharacterized protein LOC122241193 isoform X2 [Panthera tigris]|uniref:uncharacterized protein LOC122241193 isoform X2 n=1 Tax=Panthera tigris TaxID=9694 RepID=UPI001C6FB282|nr:uncharacterized protein LOC122241193 isoform X2 [Panthera tigris]
MAGEGTRDGTGSVTSSSGKGGRRTAKNYKPAGHQHPRQSRKPRAQPTVLLNGSEEGSVLARLQCGDSGLTRVPRKPSDHVPSARQPHTLCAPIPQRLLAGHLHCLGPCHFPCKSPEGAARHGDSFCEPSRCFLLEASSCWGSVTHDSSPIEPACSCRSARVIPSSVPTGGSKERYIASLPGRCSRESRKRIGWPSSQDGAGDEDSPAI